MNDGTNGNGPVSRVTLAFVAVVLIATLVTGVQGYALKELERTTDRLERNEGEAAEAHDALCSLKQDLADRSATTREFIDDITAGQRPPITGISTNDLERSYDTQQATLKSLAPLDCT